MKLTYVPRYNIAYLRLLERGDDIEVETVHVSDELNVDLAPDGTVFGIELLNANAQLGGQDGGSLIVINEAAGLRHEVSLSG